MSVRLLFFHSSRGRNNRFNLRVLYFRRQRTIKTGAFDTGEGADGFFLLVCIHVAELDDIALFDERNAAEGLASDPISVFVARNNKQISRYFAAGKGGDASDRSCDKFAGLGSGADDLSTLLAVRQMVGIARKQNRRLVDLRPDRIR